MLLNEFVARDGVPTFVGMTRAWREMTYKSERLGEVVPLWVGAIDQVVFP